MIRRAKGFEMRILAYDICRDEKLIEKLGFEYTSLTKVLQEADFVTLHLPLNDKTRGLIRRKGDKADETLSLSN